MLRTKLSKIVLVVAALILSASSIAFAHPSVSPRQQDAQPLNIGVLGPFDGPTAQGVTLAVQRISALGPVTTPDGTTYTLQVISADANTAQEVTAAVDKLKQANVVAIFGPDDDGLAINSLAALQATGLPVFTASTSLDVSGAPLIFRTRAPDNFRMNALADVMLTDLSKTKFAVFQGNDEVQGQVAELVRILTQRGTPPAQPVIQTPEGKVSDSVQVLMESEPEVVFGFGDSAQVAELYRTLRGSGFNGTFATPRADARAFIQSIPEALRDGIYGVTNWPYSWDVPDSSDFLRDYVASFGVIPTSLSASAYDSAVALIIAIKRAGIAPDALREAILALPRANSLQGFFNPAVGNNNLSASVSIIITNPYGAPTLVARYEGTERVNIEEVPPTPIPTATFPPSPTPDGVVGTAKSTVNVRTGPDTIYDRIGQLRRNEQVKLIGANADFTWFVIPFRQGQGWVSGSLLTIFGDVRTLPVIPAPPTPTPAPATLTPTPTPFANIILVSASVSPANPQPGQPMTIVAVIQNQGTLNAPEFAVATSLKPGEVYTAAIVPGLAGGQQTTVNLTNTVNGTGAETVAIVLDLNNQVDEGPAGEADNSPNFSYKVDRPYIAQGTINIAPVNSVDFQGGTADVSYDGSTLAPLNGAVLGVLNTPLANVHYDMLTPSVVNNNTGVPQAQLTANQTIGIYTAEGKRGVLRVSGFSGATLILDYFIYGP